MALAIDLICKMMYIVKQYIACRLESFLNQEMLSELVIQSCVREVRVSESLPSKGKALRTANKRVWIVTVILVNGGEFRLLSTRGSQREWASLDRLDEWLRLIGLGNYYVVQMGDRR